MKILFAIFLCTTCVLCIPTTNEPVSAKELTADPFDNDISLSGVVTDEADKKPVPINTAATTKAVLEDLEKKGEKIFDSILKKIADEMDVKMNISDTESNKDDKTETPPKETVSATAEVGDIQLDPKSKISEHKATDAKLIKSQPTDSPKEIQNASKSDVVELTNYDYIPDDFIFNNKHSDNRPIPDAFENPDDSVFDIAPPGIESPEYMFNSPKLDRNINKLETENKHNTDDKEEKFVEIPLNVQQPNQEDRYLPDVDIMDTILNDPSFSNPILSPYDTLPLSTSSSDPIENEVSGETVPPLPIQDVHDNVPSDSEFGSSVYNSIKSASDKDLPFDYDEATYIHENQDPQEEMPLNKNYDYDYDAYDRTFPMNNPMTVMNPYQMNHRHFEQPYRMANNYDYFHMTNPINDFQATLYSYEPLNGYQRAPTTMKDHHNPPVPNREVPMLMEQIFPGIFKNGFSPKHQEEITIFIEDNPEMLTKKIKPIMPNADRNIQSFRQTPMNVNKQNDPFIIEIGNTKPMKINHINKQADRFNYFPVDNFNSQFDILQRKPLLRNQFNDDNYQPFGIPPVKEEHQTQNGDSKKSVIKEIAHEDVSRPNESIDPEELEYLYRTYAPLYHHAMYMHPEEYKFRYPNKQYLPRPYFNGPPETPFYHYADQQNYFQHRPMPYQGPPVGPPMNPMNYNGPVNDYNYRNDMRNNYNRYPAPDQHYQNNNYNANPSNRFARHAFYDY